MISFTCIPDTLKYPPSVAATLSTAHSKVVSYVVDHYNNTFKQRQTIVRVLNTISYIVINHGNLPDEWDNDPLSNISVVDEVLNDIPECIRQLYLDERLIDWDLEAVDGSVTLTTSAVTTSDAVPAEPARVSVSLPTPKESLYIRPPVVPKFDVKAPWASGQLNNTPYVIYRSLPVIPTQQNEISVTTDVNKMTTQELRNLYPNVFIRTRAACMYEPVDGLELHPQLGLIIPINGFTRAQLIDNLIKYPHIYRILRCVDNETVSFYTTIELDGELYKVSDVWSTIPESSKIPYTSDFIKEYVVRRYLLERDIYHTSHTYPMFGTLDPFLTLFTTPEDYIRWGYSDIEGMARQCVQSRVSFKQSRNPILRRLNNV